MYENRKIRRGEEKKHRKVQKEEWQGQNGIPFASGWFRYGLYISVFGRSKEMEKLI